MKIPKTKPCVLCGEEIEYRHENKKTCFKCKVLKKKEYNRKRNELKK